MSRRFAKKNASHFAKNKNRKYQSSSQSQLDQANSSHHSQSKKQTSNSASNESSAFYSKQRLTIYGRNPVLEALMNPGLTPQKLFVSHQAQGDKIHQIIQCAHAIALPIEKLSSQALSRISKNTRQDQGVALDLYTPHIQPLHQALQNSPVDHPIFLLDRIQTPANLGMMIRSLCAADVGGIILPKKGGATLNPLSIKASAGTAFKAPIWTCETSREALVLLQENLSWPIYALSSHADHDLYQHQWPQQSIWILGNESEGVQKELNAWVTQGVALSMSSHVESLNVAVSASLVAFELRRQRLLKLIV
jgi:23S rRNA (guanosine2251-2'-O)-methyltransferase